MSSFDNPGFRLLRSETKDLTPEFVQQFMQLEGSPTERSLSEPRLRTLRRKADHNHLITFNWATARMGDKVLRMNGQHSSTMLSGLNGQFPQGLKVHHDEYEVDDEHGLAMLFRQFDYREGSRSPKDVAGAYQGLIPALREVPTEVVKLTAEAIAWYDKYVQGVAAPTGDDRYELLNDESSHPFIKWLAELYSIKTPELRRTQVASAMYATFNANATEARTFWNHVSRGGVLFEDNAPATILDNWLKSAIEDKRRVPVKPAQYYQGCIYAWNAYRGERSLRTIQSDASKGFFSPVE